MKKFDTFISLSSADQKFVFEDLDVVELEKTSVPVPEELSSQPMIDEVQGTRHSVDYVLKEDDRLKERNFPREKTLSIATQQASELSNLIFEVYIDPQDFENAARQAYEDYFSIQDPADVTAQYFTEKTLKNFAEELGVELTDDMIQQKIDEHEFVNTLKENSTNEKMRRDATLTLKKVFSKLESFLGMRLPLSQKRVIAQYVLNEAKKYKDLQMAQIDREFGSGAVDDLSSEVLFQYFLRDFDHPFSDSLKNAYLKFLEVGYDDPQVNDVINQARKRIGEPRW